MLRRASTYPLLIALALLIPLMAGDRIGWSADDEAPAKPEAPPKQAAQQPDAPKDQQPGAEKAQAVQPTVRPAPLPIVEVLPANEWGSIMLASPNDAARRWDEQFVAIGGNLQGMFAGGCRGIVGVGFGYIGLGEEARHDAAIGILSPGKINDENDTGRGWFSDRGLVLAVPIVDRNRLISKISNPDMVVEEGVYRTKENAALSGWLTTFTTSESHVFFEANNNRDEKPAKASEWLRHCTNGPRLATVLSPFAKESLGRADLLFHVGVGAAIRDGVDEARFDWTKLPNTMKVSDPAQQELMQEIEAAMQNLEHGFFGVTANDGLSMQTRLQFKNDPHAPSTKLIEQFLPAAGSPEATTGATLDALPTRRPLMALSAATTGKRQFQLIHLLSSFAIQSGDIWGNVFGGVHAWSASDYRPTVLLGLFSELIERSDSVKFGVYPNADGTFGIVVILNAKDPAESIAALRELSDLLVQGLGAADPAKPLVSESQVRSLIRQLASDDFFIRNRANTRLLLIGQQAVAELDKFRESDNKELAARVAQLIDTINLGKRDGEAKLLQGNLLAEIHPKLTYHVDAEQLGKRSVDVIKLSLPENEAVFQQQLEAIFGAEWNQVRVTSVGRSVVMTMGTIGPLLEETVLNLEQRAPGLSLNPSLVTLPEDRNRLFLLHVPVGRLIDERGEFAGRPAWMPLNKEPTGALTGMGISVDSTGIWTDLHIPADELRLIVAKRGGYFQ